MKHPAGKLDNSRHQTLKDNKTQFYHPAVRKGWDSADDQLKISDILDSLPFYVLLIDEHHRILQANRAVREHLGVEPQAIVGRHCPEVIHGTKGPWYACPLEEALQKDRAVEREAIDKKSGRWILSAIYPVRKLSSGKTIFFHMVTDINDRKQAEEQLRISREQLRDLARHLETVREEERTIMAREIHDELGQKLATLKIYLSWLTQRLPRDQELLLENAKIMYDLIDMAINTVMRVSTELRPGALDDFGLVSAIKWQICEFAKWTKIKFEFTSSPRNIALDKERSTALFRICNEALTNVVRHAGATQVKVSLVKRAGRVLLTISDNGKGITKKQISNQKAFGLIGMRERARFWGGEVNINGTPGKGTRVAVSIPLVGTGYLSGYRNSL